MADDYAAACAEAVLSVPDRALPGWAVDRIRDGADLRGQGNKAVWAALVKTASSAQKRGQGQHEWADFVTDVGSQLGRQVQSKDGRNARTPLGVEKELTKAWKAAAEWLAKQDPAWSREQVRTHASERAAAVCRLLEEPNADLSDRERAVMAYAAEQTEKRGMLRVALPWRAVMAATGLTERTTKATLKLLTDRGLLTLEVPGRRGEPGRRRANLYALPPAAHLTPYMCRVPRPMGLSGQAYGTPTSARLGTPARPMGPLTPQQPPKRPPLVRRRRRSGLLL